MADASVDAYAYPHNETVTGVMTEVVRPDADGLVLVDGTSAAAGMRFDPANVDAYYFAPQKAFASDGGLWLALVSPAAIERIERLATTGRWTPASLSLPIALENSRLDQTYNTPALGSLVMLDANVRWMLDQGGLEFTTGRCDQSAEILYGWAEASAFASPFVAKPSERSHTVATIDFADTVDGIAVAQGAACQRRARHRAVPQARAQPVAHRDVPRHRARRRRRAHPLHRLRGRRPRLTGPRGSSAVRDGGRDPESGDQRGRHDPRLCAQRPVD